MKRTIAAVAVAIGVSFAASAVYADQTSSPNKNVVAASQSGLTFNTNPIVTVQIANNSRKKRTLEVTGTLSTAFSTATITADVYVNGVAIEPLQIANKCAGTCSLSGTWFVDIDQAELANPGVFYYDRDTNNSPLLIELRIGANSATTGTASVTAKLLKR